MDKIEKLASITTSEFIKALVQVIEKEGFVDVNVDNNAIVATLKSMLSETPHCFIVLEQKLSGTTNTDDIVNDIVRTQNKYSRNTKPRTRQQKTASIDISLYFWYITKSKITKV